MNQDDAKVASKSERDSWCSRFRARMLGLLGIFYTRKIYPSRMHFSSASIIRKHPRHPKYIYIFKYLYIYQQNLHMYMHIRVCSRTFVITHA